VVGFDGEVVDLDCVDYDLEDWEEVECFVFGIGE